MALQGKLQISQKKYSDAMATFTNLMNYISV